ncbi:MAG: hypothetical protein PHS17_14595 [Desulfobacterales bacterium]|nr:hypothetical protein [Desulfobacterales bacterium]
MSIPIIQGGSCCAPAPKDIRLLFFPDGCQIGVKGLDTIFEEAYREGKSADQSLANEMVARLSKNNYIPDSAWPEYEEAVFKEYQRFVKAKKRS